MKLQYFSTHLNTRTAEHTFICTYINRINGCPRQRIYTDSRPTPSNPKRKCFKRTSLVAVSIRELFSNPPTLNVYTQYVPNCMFYNFAGTASSWIQDGRYNERHGEASAQTDSASSINSMMNSKPC